VHWRRVLTIPHMVFETGRFQPTQDDRSLFYTEGGTSKMSSSSAGKHASTGPASGQAPIPEPSFAERTRTLMHMGRVGSLSTWSRKQPGFPFGSLMPYALDALGRPTFLVSTMAMHTQNLQSDPRASLFVMEPDASGDPLGASRATLLGSVTRIPEPELMAARSNLTRHPDSRYWVDFDDFFFYRMNVMDVYYVGGFGVMAWVEAAEYAEAQPDPLIEYRAEIIRHMNADHQDALRLLAKRFTGIEAQNAEMTSVDRLGFQLRLRTQEGVRGARIAFLRQVSDPTETRNVFVEMLEQARQP
jgi:heme iron utilization protein